ncbi:hypothetical protein SNEBB_010158 [Seison nebaliae]|nr:hypothetical protein SNEBB_010158 [Seison nebaliae]
MGEDFMKMTEEDASKMLQATIHLGSVNCNFQMESYVYDRNMNGNHIINIKKTWDKLVLAARAICAVPNPSDVVIISAKPEGQRAVLKFGRYAEATAIAGRFTPGSFTNQIQKAYKEPRIIIVCDPAIDHQSIREAAYVNIPVIAFCNTDNSLKNVDICIPCNNASTNGIGLMVWLLCREVLRIRGELSRTGLWDVMCDLFFFRDVEKEKKEEERRKDEKQAEAAKQEEDNQSSEMAHDSNAVNVNWDDYLAPVDTNFSEVKT